jgi:hypothetical protein
MLDIMENSLDARARRIEVRIDEDPDNELLTLEIQDDGKGMDARMLQDAANPFFTTRKTRSVGLGLSMLSESVRATGGEMTVESSLGKGTRVRATFQSNHIDMKPLGDVPQTLLTLMAGHPEIELRYDHTIGGDTFSFDTGEIQAELGSPQALRQIGERLRKGLDELTKKAKNS